VTASYSEGYSDTTTIALSGVAKADFTVALSSDGPTLLPVPATVSVTPGMSSIPLPIQTVAHSLLKAVTVQIHATYAGRTISLGVVVAPPRILGVLIKPTTLVAGQSAAGVVRVNHPPLAGTIPIALSSSSPGFADAGRQAAVLVGHITAPFVVEARASVTLTMATLTGGHSERVGFSSTPRYPPTPSSDSPRSSRTAEACPSRVISRRWRACHRRCSFQPRSTTAMFTVTTKIVATTRTAIIMAGRGGSEDRDADDHALKGRLSVSTVFTFARS